MVLLKNRALVLGEMETIVLEENFFKVKKLKIEHWVSQYE